MPEQNPNLDAAMIGKMYVTGVTFQWCEAGSQWNNEKNKQEAYAGHWNISATLSDKPSRYGDKQTMQFNVEQGVGAKLVECLIPVVMADAARKADQLARDSKAMMEALGNRTVACIAQGANHEVQE